MLNAARERRLAQAPVANGRDGDSTQSPGHVKRTFVVSAEDNALIEQIAARAASYTGSQQLGRNSHKRAFDLACTLLTECHRLCRPLALKQMAEASADQIRGDLTTLRQHFDMGGCTLPHTVNLRFEARFWQEKS
ncbi:hypothetical protein FOH24_07160 [Acetobacter tropicalis]|uniref:Uncharacterized protein n=1 Tax=Acetobacter tropicalis TaxID=104102 RepID=A0A094YKG6_9PROT|nr:hypothetical protein [Acetobacter tropicalis]KAA8387066.1 hypothetical protein FOH22_10505 [Acetobacter tropicalis]KAA8391411.1 hypothetical protein FOH24_07160 [Acetobacter tropicalis]KGB21139.1 hypothetical protein AtDm6_3134 [Acetobacter tropicalis]MBC9008764.1 hypothetical protein [Acetobacter tropicalis]MDO8171937.1 hypothetical protein [Acetobacter tropicalis]